MMYLVYLVFDNTSRVKNAINKVELLGSLWEERQTEASLSRYIPGLTKSSRQGQVYSIETQKTCTADTYSDMKNLELVIQLASNCYTNFSSMEIVSPVYFKKPSNKASNLAATMVTVNNFFAHW